MDEHFLILSAQKGEKEAFQSLVALYYPYVSKFLLKLCNNKELCEDLTQDTFVKIIKSIDKFNIHGSASFSTYVMTIAKNCYIDHLRKNRQSVIRLEDQEIIADDNIQDMVIGNLQIEETLRILERLPPEQASAIRLKYFEQQTLQEIAERFQCEPKTIKSRIHNGIVKLRQALKGDGLNGRSIK